MGVARLVLAASFGPLLRGFGLRGFGGHLAGVSRAVHAAPTATANRYANGQAISGTRGGSPTPAGICSARTSRTFLSYPKAAGWIYFRGNAFGQPTSRRPRGQASRHARPRPVVYAAPAVRRGPGGISSRSCDGSCQSGSPSCNPAGARGPSESTTPTLGPLRIS